MDKNAVRLRLRGKVPIGEFAVAMNYLAGLMNALSDDIAGLADIDWQIFELEAASADVGLLGISEQTEAVEQVVNGFGVVGNALKSNAPIPYSAAVIEQAYNLTSIINGHVTSISFEVEGQESEVSEPVVHGDLLDTKEYVFGTITGIAKSLLRNPFRISMEDDLFERVVTCYTPSNYEEIMREVWGKRVSITGLIYRNPDTGRPELIKNVVELVVLEELRPLEGFEAVRGILSWNNNDDDPEMTIRQLRDDGL